MKFDGHCSGPAIQEEDFAGPKRTDRYAPLRRETKVTDSGYVALYRFVASKDEVRILAIRHQRELGFQP